MVFYHLKHKSSLFSEPYTSSVIEREPTNGRRLRCADRGGSSLYCDRLWCQAEGLANPSSYQPLPADESTIDDKVDARDERRSAARKEYGGTDHFLRRRQATHRRVPREYLHLVGDFRPTIDGCQCLSRTNRVDPNTTANPLHRQTLGEMNDSGLGRIIICLLQVAVDDRARYGSDVDN